MATLNVAGVLQADQFLESWQTWWLGDVIGMLVFAPVFLTWRQSLHIGHRRWRLGELGAAFALLMVTSLLVFFAPAPGEGVASPLTFLPLPALVWIAFRFRPSGVANLVRRSGALHRPEICQPGQDARRHGQRSDPQHVA